MADGAVLAHHVLVLKHHARRRAVVRTGVGTANQIDDLIGLDAGGARIDRVGADAGQIVDLEGGDGAVVFHADLGRDAMIAGVDVGDEALDAVGDEFHRPLEHFRQRHRRHLVGISVHLDAERAADVLGDHLHLALGELEMLGEQVLHHVRRLRALIDGQALFARIPVGDDGARLVGDAGVAAEQEGGLDHGVGFGETFRGIADLELAFEAQIVAELGMDHRRCRIERGLRIGDGRQRFVVDLDELNGVFGFRARAGDDGADRLALPADAVDGDSVLRRRFQALQVREHADPGADHLASSAPVTTATTPGAVFAAARLDALDPRMRMRRAQEGRMQHTGQHDIADILRRGPASAVAGSAAAPNGRYRNWAGRAR